MNLDPDEMDPDAIDAAEIGRGVRNASRAMAIVVCTIFGGIGITVLIFVWSARGWDAPPLFFRIFASFIALAFIAVPLVQLIVVFSGGGRRARRIRRRRPPPQPDHPERSSDPGSRDFGCPNCGAGLGADTEISPSGDVKCPFCSQWFSTRRRR